MRRATVIRCCCATTACTIDGSIRRALELAGIDANTPDPHNGIIVRDPQAGPRSGLLFEAASHRVERVAREAHPDTLETDSVALARALEILNSYGVTGLQDAAVSGDVLAAYATPRAAREALDLGGDFADGRSDRLSQRHDRRRLIDRRSRTICESAYQDHLRENLPRRRADVADLGLHQTVSPRPGARMLLSRRPPRRLCRSWCA